MSTSKPSPAAAGLQQPGPSAALPSAGRLCACCALCGCAAAVGAVMLFGAPVAGQLAFFDSGDFHPHVLPMAPPSFPEAFQGVIWMDQAGVYGHSDIALPFPDLAVSFGDIDFSQYDPKSRTLAVDVVGPAWTWQNRWQAYVSFAVIRLLRFFYLFELSRDGTVIHVYPSLDLGYLGKWHMPKALMSFTMEKIPTPPGTVCPPRAGATKKDVAKCAKWDRVSTTCLTPLLGERGVLHYYAFQIVDAKGRPVQPYYDEYLNYANNTCKPNRRVAELLGIAGPNVTECPTAFVGIRPQSSRAALARPGSEL